MRTGLFVVCDYIERDKRVRLARALRIDNRPAMTCKNLSRARAGYGRIGRESCVISREREREAGWEEV